MDNSEDIAIVLNYIFDTEWQDFFDQIQEENVCHGVEGAQEHIERVIDKIDNPKWNPEKDEDFRWIVKHDDSHVFSAALRASWAQNVAPFVRNAE